MNIRYIISINMGRLKKQTHNIVPFLCFLCYVLLLLNIYVPITNEYGGEKTEITYR